VGVPSNRTTIALFMIVSFAAWFVGQIYLFRLTSIQANAGFGFELIYIAAAVIGGCLLTGGYGSVAGTALGALALGMAQIGIVYASINADWNKIATGALLLSAVVLNNWIRRRFAGLR